MPHNPPFREQPGLTKPRKVLAHRLFDRVARSKSSLAVLLALGFALSPSAQTSEDGGGQELASPPQPTEMNVKHVGGQTYISWRERSDLTDETYRIYRWDRPFTPGNFDNTIFVYEVSEGSSAFWSDYWPCATGCVEPTDTWEPRFSATMPLAPPSGNLGIPADSDQGMLVWTVAPEDKLGIATMYFYAVTTVDSNGIENRVDFTFGDNMFGPFFEGVGIPRPLKLQETVDGTGVKQHVYVQYMDLHTWNPTLHAPNAVHADYGQNLSDPKIANAIQYAFSYVILEPPGPVTQPLPVVLKLHPYLRDTLPPNKFLDAVSNIELEENYDYPAIEIRPIDVGSTWWFGFAEKGFDYRAYSDRCAAIDAMAATSPDIQNYTEARVLRMLYDLQRDTGYWNGKVDPERYYVVGHSMGGAGAMGMSLRYPDRFAAAYATAPVVNFHELVDPLSACVTPVNGSSNCPQGFQYDLAYDVALKFGPTGSGPNPYQHVYPAECGFDNPPGHTQTVTISGPSDWADHLQIYDGTPVYDWQDHGSNFGSPPAGEIVPINIRHSSTDSVINWKFQGRPVYEELNGTNQAWSGLVEDFLSHFKPWWFLGTSPNYANLPSQGPFFGLSAVLSETIPGFRLHTQRNTWLLPVPSSGVHIYNSDFLAVPGAGGAVEWSSSWNSWDGAPIDNPGQWRMSLRTFDGGKRIIDVTPRRVQNFNIVPGELYNWELTRLNGKRIKCGCLTASADGTITIKDLAITGAGRRLRIRKGNDPSCISCITTTPGSGHVPLLIE